MIRLEPNRRSIAHFSLSYCTSLQKNIFFGTGSKHFETPAYLIFDHGVRPKSNFDLAPFSKVIFLAEFVKILRILSSHLANSHHLASVWPGKNHSRSASRNETFGSVLHVSGFFCVFSFFYRLNKSRWWRIAQRPYFGHVLPESVHFWSLVSYCTCCWCWGREDPIFSFLSLVWTKLKVIHLYPSGATSTQTRPRRPPICLPSNFGYFRNFWHFLTNGTNYIAWLVYDLE